MGLPAEKENKKRTAADNGSVGADPRQQSSKTIISITQNCNQIKCYYTDIRSNLPAQIIEDGHFCCWRYEKRNGQKTKIPYNPLTGKPAKSNNISSFAGFETAMDTLTEGYDGIGIGIFNGICAVDLDNCVDADGKRTDTADEIVKLLHSYTECSPGGRGLHILFRADNFDYDMKRCYIMNHRDNIEVYVSGATQKYVTITGKACEKYEFGERSDELRILLERFMLRPAKKDAKDAVNAINALNSDPDTDLTDDEILDIAVRSKNGASFSDLFSGNFKEYPSQSEADMALCCRLAFWTGRDARKMDRLFRRSGLMREKWDRAQSGTTYGAITIQKAIENCRECYAPVQKEKDSFEFPPIVPLTPKCSELPPFPTDALPDVIQKYSEAVALQSQTSPDMAAVIGLGVLAVCLQGKFKVEGMPGYYEPLSLYTVVIAAPGERKSGVMRAMTGSLYEYEQKFNDARAEEVRKNQRKRESIERQINGLKKKLESKSTREAEMELQQLEMQLDDMPEMKPVRFFADDCTGEALTSLISENGGILSVISTEGGIFDIMAGRYCAKTNIDVWLKGHCGDAIYVDRMSRKSECIPHPALSAVLTIQPSVLNEIMENTTMTGRGLIARFLYAFPPSKIGSRVFRSPAVPPEITEEYKQLIFRLMTLPVPDEPAVLHLCEEAADVISAHFDEHEKYLAGEGQVISDWAGKYIGTVLRIAGLLHGAESKSNEAISAETMMRAIRIGQYFLAHSCYAYSMMGSDLNIRKARFVMAKLLKQGKSEIKRSELFQVCRGKFFHKTEELIPTLELLEEHGYIRQLMSEHPGPGRPPDIRILLNPAV